jgi:hypothetical protein
VEVEAAVSRAAEGLFVVEGDCEQAVRDETWQPLPLLAFVGRGAVATAGRGVASSW